MLPASAHYMERAVDRPASCHHPGEKLMLPASDHNQERAVDSTCLRPLPGEI
jgi:hypothetical protein